MPFDNNGNYTPPAGAESAAPSGVIRSATWNSIFTDMSTALTTLGNIQYSQNARTVSTPGAVTILTTDALVEITVSVSVINLPAASLMLWPVRIAGNATGIFASHSAVITPTGTDKVAGQNTLTLTNDFQTIDLIPVKGSGWLTRPVISLTPTGTLIGNTTGATNPPIVLTAPAAQALLGQTFVAIQIPNINFNSANTDTTINITLTQGYSRYRIPNLILSGASASISTATCAVFTGAGGTGTAVVASGTVITVTSAAENTNNNTQFISGVNNGTQSFNATTLFFRVQTPQGSAATATATLIIQPVS